MGRQTLKFLRLLIPGLILIFEFLPMLNQLKVEVKIGEGWLNYSFLIIPAIVIGGLYHLLKIREFITNYSHRKFNLNITSSLLRIYGKPINQTQSNFLKEKRLMHVLYNLIDNDASLKAKSELMHFNGIFWTSTADIFLISLFSSIIYFIGVLVFDVQAFLSIGIVLLAISLLGIALHILTIFYHINLSNDQLGYIETHYVNNLKIKLDEVLQQLS